MVATKGAVVIPSRAVSASYPAENINSIRLPSWPYPPRVKVRDDGKDEITLRLARAHPDEQWEWVELRNGKVIAILVCPLRGFRRTDYASVLCLPPGRLEDIHVSLRAGKFLARQLCTPMRDDVLGFWFGPVKSYSALLVPSWAYNPTVMPRQDRRDEIFVEVSRRFEDEQWEIEPIGVSPFLKARRIVGSGRRLGNSRDVQLRAFVPPDIFPWFRVERSG